MLNEVPTYPKYEYTFAVLNLLFDRGAMNIKFIPANTTLTAFDLVVLIRPEMDVNNLKPYLDNFAPNSKWFAQEVILAHGAILMSNI